MFLFQNQTQIQERKEKQLNDTRHPFSLYNLQLLFSRYLHSTFFSFSYLDYNDHTFSLSLSNSSFNLSKCFSEKTSRSHFTPQQFIVVQRLCSIWLQHFSAKATSIPMTLMSPVSVKVTSRAHAPFFLLFYNYMHRRARA